MKVIYKCDVCGREFGSELTCIHHESHHFEGVERIKYELHNQSKDPCDYCKNSYYVYGCERDCGFNDCNCSNNYKDFVPVEPFHNKRESGGV